MDEDPVAGPSRDLDDPIAIAASKPSEQNSKASAGANDGSDSEDDAAPDYSALAALANKLQGQGGPVNDRSADDGTSKLSVPFIPKRGEKDFEPTGFVAQGKALEASRKAMFDVIQCERYISSKSISIATWEPSLNRAIVHLSRGQTFGSIGYANRVQVLEDGQYADLAQAYAKPGETLAKAAGTKKDGVWWPRIQSRLELFPEEALYLVERGSMECRVHSDYSGQARRFASVAGNDLRDYGDDHAHREWVPMTLEQAYATMLYKDDLTRERYQLYAHLRRLGYIVQRKHFTDALRAAAAKKDVAEDGGEDKRHDEQHIEGIIADPKRPLPLVTLFDVLLYPIRRVLQTSGSAASKILQSIRNIIRRLRATASHTYGSIWMPRSLGASSTSAPDNFAPRGLLGIGGVDIRTYEKAYDRLRIVPTGHDATLKRRLTKSNEPRIEIFFYAWRPATHFKKTDPPLPEFQLATADARNTLLLSAFAFADLFSQLPKALSADDLAQLDEGEQRELRRAQEEKKRNDQSYGKAAARKMKSSKAANRDYVNVAAHSANASGARHAVFASLTSLSSILQRVALLLESVSRLFAHLPPGCHKAKRISGNKGSRGSGANSANRRPGNIYVPLKAGRRNVIVAVNDCGTTSLLRFGESEFARWRLAGTREA